MKLKIRYENEVQYLDLNGEETDQLWVSLSLEGEGLSEEEREQLIQKKVEEVYNRPDYNNWHKHNRHCVPFGIQSGDNEDGDDRDVDEPLMEHVADDRIFRGDEISREEQEQYNAICYWVRETLKDKPHWVNAFIAVCMDGVPTKDYAASIGKDPSAVTHWLTRAKKKLQEKYDNRQF